MDACPIKWDRASLVFYAIIKLSGGVPSGPPQVAAPPCWLVLSGGFCGILVVVIQFNERKLMEDTPTAAGEAPQAPQTEANPQTTNSGLAQAPEPNSVDLHGFTSEDLAEMRKFYDANGGFKAVKSKISNYQPQKVTEAPQAAPELQNNMQPTSHTQQTPEAFRTPQGAITAQEFLAEQYFRSLAGEEKYANIADGVRNGDYLKEMSAFGIQPLNPDGSINDQKVRMYLDLKSQTVPAKPTETTPDASAAPTVTYTEVGENGIENIDQAYKILMEPGNAARAKAEEFIKKTFNKQ